MNTEPTSKLNNETEIDYTTDLRYFFSPNFTMTKRQLGVILLLAGVVGFLGILVLDLVGGGREGGIGPAQQFALLIMAGVALVGLSLIPLGDKPA